MKGLGGLCFVGGALHALHRRLALILDARAGIAVPLLTARILQFARPDQQRGEGNGCQQARAPSC
ncbi:hypothetical protein ACFSUK_18905 [Sphingobium scionense]